MALNDPLANAFSVILNAERNGKQTCVLRVSSKLIKKSLEILQDAGYLGSFEEAEDNRGKLLTINLIGHLNKCGVIKPRFAVQLSGFEKFEKRYLPSKNLGILLVSTPTGLKTHKQAREA